ncbi:hypothetical protein [Streptomyces sp. NPDC059009]|uniref:hypothetical protein n=1 Tax=Streptomyces sp. NPDC059009 TaxID=3346694 RepID=UPI0036BF3AD0
MATYDFPQRLTEAQDELDQVRAELQPLLQRLPWSVEPMDSWESHDNAWRKVSRPVSPGWDEGDRETVDRLRAREVKLAELIVTHPWWDELPRDTVPSARDALKHHREQPQEAGA